MFKILVLGAGGFIGGHVMKYLGNLGYEIDTLSTSEFMAEDWKRLDDFKLSEEGTKPDYVINCAWIRNKDLHSTDHLEMAESVCHLYQECANRGIKVINLGSSSEYGVKDTAMKEDMICEPISTYGIAKLSVTLFAKKLGFNTLRLFAVTGKGGHTLVDVHEKTDKLSHKNGNRDYVRVEDVCVIVELLMHARQLFGEVINVCTGVATRNWQIVEKGNDDERWHKYPIRQYEPNGWFGNPDKARYLFCFIASEYD